MGSTLARPLLKKNFDFFFQNSSKINSLRYILSAQQSRCETSALCRGSQAQQLRCCRNPIKPGFFLAFAFPGPRHPQIAKRVMRDK